VLININVIDDIKRINPNTSMIDQDKNITDISIKYSLCWDSMQELIDDGFIKISDNNLLSVNNH